MSCEPFAHDTATRPALWCKISHIRSACGQLGTISLADHSRGPCCHCSGNLLRRMAHSSYDGIPHYEAEAGRRLLRRDCRSHHSVLNGACRYSGKHHPYDYGSDRRSGRYDAVVRSSLGRSSTNCLGLDSYHPGFCDRGGSRILGLSSS